MKSRIVGIVFCLALLAGLVTGGVRPVPASADAPPTTSLTVTKYNVDGTTVLATTIKTYQDMMTLPVQGDGIRHYYMEGPTYDPNNPWDPSENVTAELKDKGAVKGTDVKDLCELVGGADPGDQIQILAADGYGERFQYTNIYDLDPNQGKMVICWYTRNAGQNLGAPLYPDGASVPAFEEGMQLVFMAPAPNAAGLYVFGDWDMGHYLPQANWHYNDGYPSCDGLSIKWITAVNIYKNLQPWSLQLVGPYSDNITESLFENGVVCSDANHGKTWTDASHNIWKGMPLWLLCGWADDANNHLGVGAFNDALARAGYTVRLTSDNGTTSDLASQDVARNANIIVANTENGQQLSAPGLPAQAGRRGINRRPDDRQRRQDRAGWCATHRHMAHTAFRRRRSHSDSSRVRRRRHL